MSDEDLEMLFGYLDITNTHKINYLEFLKTFLESEMKDNNNDRNINQETSNDQDYINSSEELGQEVCLKNLFNILFFRFGIKYVQLSILIRQL